MVPYAHLFMDSVGPDFILLDYNTCQGRGHLVDEILESDRIRSMNWRAKSRDMNPIDHLWDILERIIGTRFPLPRTTHSLKTTLLEE